MQTLLVLVSIAAASDQSDDVLVTDVIRFYDQDCWTKFCDAEVVACISESEHCQKHFQPLPHLVNLVPTEGRLSTAQPVKEDDAGGGPMLGFAGVHWDELAAPEMKVIECAKQHQCAPTEAYVKQDDALVQPMAAAAPSSFMEVGHAEQIQNMKAQVQSLKDMLMSGDTSEIKERMAEMHSNAREMKARLNQLNAAKNSVSDVASVHSKRMHMLEAMQRQGVDQVQQEKAFIDASRTAMAKSQEKLLRLAQVQNPTEADFLELASTKQDMDNVRKNMMEHLSDFKKSFKLPELLEKTKSMMLSEMK